MGDKDKTGHWTVERDADGHPLREVWVEGKATPPPTEHATVRGPQPWRGRKEVRRKLSAKPVALGDYVVPAAVTWAVTGRLGDPDLRVEFAVRNGRPECIEVHIVAKPHGRALRDSDLAAVEIEQAVAGVFTAVALYRISDHEAAMPWDRTDEEAWRLRAQVEAAAKAPTGPPLAELHRVAEIYTEHRDHQPLKMLEALLGYSTRTAARRAKQARDAGLITGPPATKRKAK